MTAFTLPEIPTVLGASVPRRGNRFSRWLARLLLRIAGWRIVGSPPDQPKFIITAAPHTSNLDGLILVVTAFALGFDMRWIGKHTLFAGPLGPLMRWTGGIEVNRGRAGGVTQALMEQFQSRAQLALVVAPEGTRRRTTTWKSGFYRIATRAELPITMGFIDYGHRRVGFGPWFIPTGDYQRDLTTLTDFYRHIIPRHPADFALPGKMADS